MHTAPATTHRVHTAVMRAVGPRAYADLAPVPTAEELADFEELIESLTSLSDEQFANRVHIALDLVPYFRAKLMAPAAVR